LIYPVNPRMSLFYLITLIFCAVASLVIMSLRQKTAKSYEMTGQIKTRLIAWTPYDMELYESVFIPERYAYHQWLSKQPIDPDLLKKYIEQDKIFGKKRYMYLQELNARKKI